jgi:hypothetical protein
MTRILAWTGFRVLVFRALAGSMALGLWVGGSGAGAAEPLDKDSCARLAVERQSLVNMGVENTMAKGPEWAKANLSGANLDLIKRFLVVSEQIKFRCRTEVADVAAKPVRRILVRKPRAAAPAAGKAVAAARRHKGAPAAKSVVKNAVDKATVN